MDMVMISKTKLEKLYREVHTLRNTALYKLLLAFEQNIKQKEYTRKELGF